MFAHIPLKLFVVLVFSLCYFFIILKKPNPLISVFCAAAILISSGAISLQQAVNSVNLNVLGIFLGTMVLSSLFIYSGVPSYLAAVLVGRSNTVGVAILLVCGLSAFISSFTENVATVFIVAPIALEIARKIKTNPVPLLVGVSLCANLQGTATMIGDSPSIILAMQSGMDFNDFFWMLGRPGIFFAVECGAVGAFYVLWRIFKGYKQSPGKIAVEKPKSWIPAILMISMVVTLALSSFVREKPEYSIALICLFWAAMGLIWNKLYRKENLSLFRDLDWHTFFFLIGIFILIGSLTSSGIIDDIAGYINSFSGDSVLAAFLIMVWVSVLVSAFVDNIPYTVAMIPVAKIVAGDLGVSVYLMLFGLAIGTCLGGNITPIGASCNVVTVGILRKHGYKIGFPDFMKMGIPFTFAAVVLGTLFVWFVWR